MIPLILKSQKKVFISILVQLWFFFLKNTNSSNDNLFYDINLCELHFAFTSAFS